MLKNTTKCQTFFITLSYIIVFFLSKLLKTIIIIPMQENTTLKYVLKIYNKSSLINNNVY